MCLIADANITPCEKKRRDAIFYSKKFIPFCKPDGSWSEIQCGKSSRDCWCVDIGGNEVLGTRGSNLEICPDFGLYLFFPLYFFIVLFLACTVTQYKNKSKANTWMKSKNCDVIGDW